MATTLLPVFIDTAERTKRKPYFMLAGLQVLDVLLTGFILHSWSERAEGNPLARIILETWGLYGGLMVLLTFKLAVVWMFYTCQTGVKIAASLYSLVLANNILFLALWAWMTLTN